MTFRFFTSALAVVAVVGPLATAVSAQQRATPAPAASQPAPPAELPNGATAIDETYGDWTVSCRIADGQKRCSLAQVQGNRQTGQRVFSFELDAPKDGQVQGTALMPFGVSLDTGAILKLDDKDLGKGLRFSTCVPQGCLLPITLPKTTTDAMRGATKLLVAALRLSDGEAISFTVSLNGFGASLDRVTQLGR